MLVLDTQLLPAAERAEAFQATVSANCSSSMASFEEPASIHAAARNLRSSPLYELVRDHVARVTAQADQLAGGVAAPELGTASAELMRALVVSAAGDQRRTHDAMDSSLPARVQAYVRNNLRDPDLTPARIAAANAVSLRALYKLYETLGQSLEQSIIEQRLRGARADLVAAHRRPVPIAAVARARGFAEHFPGRRDDTLLPS